MPNLDPYQFFILICLILGALVALTWMMDQDAQAFTICTQTHSSATCAQQLR